MSYIYCINTSEGTERFDTLNERQVAWSAAYQRGEVTCEWIELTGDDRRKVQVVNSFGHLTEWLYDNRHGIQKAIREDIPNAVAYYFEDYSPGSWIRITDQH